MRADFDMERGGPLHAALKEYARDHGIRAQRDGGSVAERRDVQPVEQRRQRDFDGVGDRGPSDHAVDFVLDEMVVGFVDDCEIRLWWEGIFELAGEGDTCVAGSENNDVHTHGWGASRMNMALDMVCDVPVEDEQR